MVDSLCVEAVNKILKVYPLTAWNQDQSVGEAPPTPDDICEEITTQKGGEPERSRSNICMNAAVVEL